MFRKPYDRQRKSGTHLDREGQAPKLEPRILLEDPDRSYHARHRVSDGDRFDNRLIFGGNLLVLKGLEREVGGPGEVRAHRLAIQLLQFLHAMRLGVGAG